MWEFLFVFQGEGSSLVEIRRLDRPSDAPKAALYQWYYLPKDTRVPVPLTFQAMGDGLRVFREGRLDFQHDQGTFTFHSSNGGDLELRLTRVNDWSKVQYGIGGKIDVVENRDKEKDPAAPSMRRIVVEDYNPDWPRKFEEIKARIWPQVRDLAHSIEHVGSTSVPGLAAKPVLDIDIVITAKDRLPPIIERLRALGYGHRGNLGIEGRDAFHAPSDLPDQHLYVCALGSDALSNHLALRNSLREDAKARDEYSSLKKALALTYPKSIDHYVDGKTDFILRLLARAGLKQEQLDAIKNINKLSSQE